MKKLHFLLMTAFITISAAILLFSCKKNNLNKDIVEIESIDPNLKIIIKARYGADIKENQDGSILLSYGDGKTVIATPLNNGSYQLKGSKIPGQIIKVTPIYSSIKKQDGFPFVVESVNDNSNIEFLKAANPCKEHPKNEGFDKCFKREWDAFCDGMTGCMAQAMFPISIGLTIAVHCKSC